MSKLTVTYRNNSINLLNPTYFEKYEEYKDLLINKIFLYSEIHPKENEIINIRDTNYQVADVFDISLTGNLGNPKRSLRQILSCYECRKFIASDSDGYLFVYTGFKSSQEEFKISESAVLLKFQVYKLQKLTFKEE